MAGLAYPIRIFLHRRKMTIPFGGTPARCRDGTFQFVSSGSGTSLAASRRTQFGRDGGAYIFRFDCLRECCLKFPVEPAEPDMALLNKYATVHGRFRSGLGGR